MGSNTQYGAISKSSDYPNRWIWKLSITTDGETYEVGYPLTVNFNVVRNTQASSNTGTFTIYNLSPSTRESKFFFQDRFATEKIKIIKFQVGYEGNLTTIFNGIIQEAYSWRNNTEIETHIQAWDVGVTNFITKTFEAGTNKKEAYKNIVSESGLGLGAIGTIDGDFKQEVTFMGRPIDILNTISGGHSFVDNGLVHTLQNKEALELSISILKAETGLLGTPKRRGAEVIVDSMLNPNIHVGQLLEIQSSTMSMFSATYKVWGVTHSGVISGSVASDCKSSFNLFIDNFIPESSYNASGTTKTTTFSKVKQEEITPVNKTYGSSIEEVYRYLQENNGAIPNIMINERISWKEMLRGNEANDLMTDCNKTILNNCKTIADRLVSFCNTYFSGRAIIVHSGYRTKHKNNRVDGAVQNSQHILGKAIDFHIQNVDIKSMQAIFNYNWSGAVGFYSWGCHVDLRSGIRFKG